MRNDLVHIVAALDGSGSMMSIWDATIKGFNAFLDDQKKQPGEVRLTVVKFDSIYALTGIGKRVRLVELCKNVPIKEFAGLNTENYRPDGGTPLYYTQGKLIDDTGKYLASLNEADRPGKVMFVTVTDGGDTDAHAHPEYSLQIVGEKIKHQREVYGWDFTYIGANQDAVATARSMNINVEKALTYGANTEGATMAFCSVSNYTSTVRSAVATGANTEAIGYTDKDRLDQAKVGVR